MTDESEIQKEWRAIVISQLESLNRDMKAIQHQMSNSMASAKDIADIKLKISETELKIEELRRNNSNMKESIFREVKSDYVTKEQFEPIKRAMYFVAAIVSAAVLGAVLKLIIN